MAADCTDFNLPAKESESGVSLGVVRAKGKKCDRCWFYSESVGLDQDALYSDICLRCSNVVRVDGYTFDAPVPVAGALPLV